MDLSIITINFNNKDGLEKTIKTVVDQTSRNFEYILIDGGSSDGSIDLIKKNSERITYWVSEQDKGIYDAINKGIKRSSGKYLMFLNSGDCLSDNSVIEICLKNIKDFPKTDIFYGDIFGNDNSIVQKWLHKHPTEAELNLVFFKTKNLNHQSSLIKASLFEEFGSYPLTYRLAADHWLYLISFLADKSFKHIDHALVLFDYTGIGSVNRKFYEKEMEQMWNNLVPKYVHELLSNQEDFENKMRRKTYKMANWIDNKIQQLKRQLNFTKNSL